MSDQSDPDLSNLQDPNSVSAVESDVQDLTQGGVPDASQLEGDAESELKDKFKL